MSSHRPYRPGLGMDAVLDEIEQGLVERYDPTVVYACVKLFREQSYVIA
jgi:putative two-component system response regulator